MVLRERAPLATSLLNSTAPSTWHWLPTGMAPLPLFALERIAQAAASARVRMCSSPVVSYSRAAE